MLPYVVGFNLLSLCKYATHLCVQFIHWLFIFVFAWIMSSFLFLTLQIQWNPWFNTTVIRDHPPKRDHFSRNNQQLKLSYKIPLFLLFIYRKLFIIYTCSLKFFHFKIKIYRRQTKPIHNQIIKMCSVCGQVEFHTQTICIKWLFRFWAYLAHPGSYST